jgi:hypothetical protein
MADTSIERFEGPKEWLASFEEGDTSPTRLLAVALVGALSSLALYYIYASLSPETRESIRDQVVNTVKQNVNKFTQV